ncbi:MAG: non-ribosomal peptide synthetase, partial [Alphaproteobacteria bacterium]
PLPPGVPGELCIAGPALACGYVGDPQATAERFVFSEWLGERVYRTGDRARLRGDGELELLGRLDGQLKLRGYRIEPGEVEAVLVSHPAVSAAVVGLSGEGAGARLAAWVVLREAVAIEALREWLAARLPGYMVPGAWQVLERLPRTPNGKLDRGALPAPAAVVPAGRGPATALEGLVCELFAGVLGLASVPADGDFFALGGHSLLAVQLVSRLRDALEVELPLRAVFESPTPAGLAAVLAAQGQAAVPAERLLPRHGDQEAPASLMQQRLWFLDQLEPGSAVYNLAVALRLSGEPDVAALQAAVDGLVARQAVLGSRIVARDGEPWQLPCGRPVRLEERLVTADGLEAALSGYASAPFDLAAGPLLRVGLFRGAGSPVLAVVVHHIVADGWSLGILLAELGALYGAALRGEPAELAPLPVSYADYARWQRDWLAGERLAAQLDYWRSQLAGAP